MAQKHELDADDATIGTILTRRDLIALAGVSGLGLLPGISRAKSPGAYALHEIDLVATPALTEGPFFVDERLNRSDVTTGTKNPNVVSGLPLTLAVKVLQIKGHEGVPLEGAMVDIWHTDAAGVYSDVHSQPIQRLDTSTEKFLRGYQLSDVEGNVLFKTIYPGWYVGRTVHIHFKVRCHGRDFSSQWFFDEALSDKVFANPPYSARGRRHVTNAMDGIFNERQVDGSTAGSKLMLKPVPSKAGPGYRAEFVIALNLA